MERVQKDFFSDPSQSGLACSRRGAPLKVGNVDTSAEGEDVVSEAKSLLFKTLRVKRIVDKEANALVYVSYSTRTRLCENHDFMARAPDSLVDFCTGINKDDDSNKARFASSLCTVSMD